MQQAKELMKLGPFHCFLIKSYASVGQSISQFAVAGSKDMTGHWQILSCKLVAVARESVQLGDWSGGSISEEII